MVKGSIKITKYAENLDRGSIDSLLSFPCFVQIETVSACNARCLMCPIEEITRHNARMSDKLFDKIVRELSDNYKYVKRVYLQGLGEPLLDKQLEKRISILKKRGIEFVTLNTNASLITSKKAESLVMSGLSEISISMDGASRATFETIRQGLVFDKCVSNIHELVRIRDLLNSPMRIRLRMVLQKINAHEANDFYHYWRAVLSSCDDVLVKPMHHFGQWIRGYELPETYDSQALNGSPCTSLWGNLFVYSDGRVPLCCNDPNGAVILGDLNESSISEIWRDSVIRQKRSIHLEQGRSGIDLCKDCIVWE